MESTLITMFSVIIVVLSLAPFYYVRYFNRSRDESIAKFYTACDRTRDHIHSCNSKAEAAEIGIDLTYIEESFENSVPKIILDKEISLLYSLLNKKSKKLK